MLPLYDLPHLSELPLALLQAWFIIQIKSHSVITAGLSTSSSLYSKQESATSDFKGIHHGKYSLLLVCEELEEKILCLYVDEPRSSRQVA